MGQHSTAKTTKTELICHHVDAAQYVRTVDGRQPPGLLAGLLLRHILEVCPRCRETWEMLPDRLQRAVRAQLSRYEPEPDHPAVALEHLSIWESPIEEDEAALSRVRRQYRLARYSLDKLLALPHADRMTKIRRSKKRFRSRMMVDLMLTRCRQQVTHDPREAELLAALVPEVVRRIPGGGGEPWRTELEALAHANRANAARVAGDFAQADRLFAQVHLQLAGAPVDDLRIRAQIASLEATLRLAQRAFGEASQQLDIATLLFRSAGDRQGSAKALTQQASLQRTQGFAKAALRSAQLAAEALAEFPSGYLYLCTVTERASSLCQLGRHAAAGHLLDAHLQLFDDSDESHVGVVLRGLRGRIALGLEDFDEAVRYFADARDAYLQLGRDYDAALASLDLAETYFEAGRMSDLRELAGQLVPLFRSNGVEREALASLALLAKAVRSGTLTASLLSEVRRAVREGAEGLRRGSDR